MAFNFQIDFSSPAITILGIAAVLFIVLLPLYFRPLWRIAKVIRRASDGGYDDTSCQPVSVIVYASDDSEALRRLLPVILGQRYNGPFEVIVVNDGQSDATVDVVERLKIIHNNLYLTYTPDGARQLSRKKLGLMIGIKAARYPIVVQTTASAAIDSDEWLSLMTGPFIDPNVEVVIGYSHLDWNKDRGPGRRSRLFNASADDVVWVDAALSGHPYRGTELNLAYTREVFFNNRGFSRSLNLKHGDDDIFVNEVANKRNTRIVLDPLSFVKRNAFDIHRIYNELRSRYNFTGRKLPHLYRRLQTLGQLLLWVFVVLCVAGGVMTLPNLFAASVAVVLLLTMFILGMVSWRKLIFALNGRKLLFTIPWLMMARPVANVIAKLKSFRYRRNNYTWK